MWPGVFAITTSLLAAPERSNAEYQDDGSDFGHLKFKDCPREKDGDVRRVPQVNGSQTVARPSCMKDTDALFSYLCRNFLFPKHILQTFCAQEDTPY